MIRLMTQLMGTAEVGEGVARGDACGETVNPLGSEGAVHVQGRDLNPKSDGGAEQSSEGDGRAKNIAAFQSERREEAAQVVRNGGARAGGRDRARL